MAQTKTYIVTGATSGIGLAAAEHLLRQGAFVIGVGRSPQRCQAAEQRLSALYPQGAASFCTADLGLQSQVRALGAQIADRLQAQGISYLDGLVNNAGMVTFRRTLTAEGFETQWAVNHLAPFLLTHLLLPLLQAAPQARVVTVSSESHYKGRMRWDDLQLRRFYNVFEAYQQSKLANVLFSAELNRRLGKGSPVRAFAADPGLVRTDIGIKNMPALIGWGWQWWCSRGITPEESARGVVFLATEPSIQQSDQVYWKHSQPKAPSPLALDTEAANRLWEISAQMCGMMENSS